MVRYWYDTEFIDTGSTIDLIIIGIVAEDGREYYAQSCEFNIDKASPWVRENVLMHLDICPYIRANLAYSLGTVFGTLAQHKQGQCVDQIYGIRHRCPWRTRGQLKRDILSFMDVETHGKPELCGYYSAYDHVAFCQLFGTMMDLPTGFPMYTRDLTQWCDQLGTPRLPEQGKGEHNALEDAKWNKLAWEFLAEKSKEN